MDVVDAASTTRVGATYSERLAEFVSSVSIADLPAATVDSAVTLIRDYVGLALAGHSAHSARIVYELVAEDGGRPDATVIGTDTRLPVRSAITANGAFAESLEYGDTHRVPSGTKSTGIHAGLCVIPAALAIAEATHATGADLIVGTVLGLEVAIRIARVVPMYFTARGYHVTSICSGFGASATVGSILGLDADRQANAIGMCLSFASGTMEFNSNGSWVKQLHVGWQATAGLYAAQLAARGFTGPRTVFEGKAGLFRTFLPERPGDMDALVRDLGSVWETDAVLPRAYPLGNISAPFIDAVLEIQRAHGVRAEDIAAIECEVAPHAIDLVCEPMSLKRHPTTPYGAKNSLPYVVALALLYQSIGVEDFTDEKYPDPRAIDLAQRVSYIANEKRFLDSGHVTMTMNDGTVYEHETPYKKGSLQNPLTRDELDVKFRRNASLAATAAEVATLDETLGKLRDMDDVARELAPALRTSGRSIR
jgi:2-methylcitrate dehydratase PrpD